MTTADDHPASRENEVGSARATIAAVSITGVAMLPVWLLGAMAADVQADLAFGAAALGGAVAVFQGVSALTSIPAGVFAERHGFRVGSLATIALFVVATAGIALLTTNWTTLVLWLGVAAAASSLSSPTVNLGLARLVDPDRRGFAFGIKQAAVPAGTIVAGLAVPLIALTIGWRWAFGLSAVAAIPLALTIPRVRDRPAGRRQQLRATPALLPPLTLLAAGAGLGSAATSSVGAFFVVSAISNGIPAGTAGLTLAAGGAISVVARIVVGWRADRRDGRHFVVVAAMMTAGAGGVAAFAFVATPGALLGATAAAFALGWGWNGLFDFALVRRMSGTPATATGVAQTGKYLGGVIGPFAFGVTVEVVGFRPAWVGAAVALLLAGATVLLARTRLRVALDAA